MPFSLDKALLSFVLTALSLLFFPDFALLDWQWGILFSVIVLFVATVVYFTCRSRLIATFVYGFFVLLGFSFFHTQARHLLQLADQVAYLPNKISTELYISEILHQQDYQTLIAEAKLQPHLPRQRIYVQWRAKSQVNLGEKWQAEVNLRPISSRLNFSGFDRQQWLFAKGVTAWASVKSAVKLKENSSWRGRLLQNALQQTKGLDLQGLLIALGFGERAWLKNADFQPYQRTGTAHLIAISGLHIGLAMALGFYLARVGQFFFPTRKITPTFPLLFGLGLAGFYAMLAGFAIPTFRAIIALLIVFCFRLKRHYYTAWQFLLRVVVILLLCDPMMILSNSFWLSLGAVSALILHYQYFPLSNLHWQGKSLSHSVWQKVRYFFALFHLQLGLLLFFMPFQLFVFNGLSLNSLWANLLAVPVYSLVLVPLILFAIFSQGAFSTWQLANYLAEKITLLMMKLQHQWLSISLTNSYFMVAILCGIFLVILFYFNRPDKREEPPFSMDLIYKPKGFHWILIKPTPFLIPTYFIVSCLLLGNFSIGFTRYFQQHLSSSWRMEILDVGQGLAILIAKQGRGILYDTGSSWRGGSMAQLEILPYLKREGIELDKLILSHDDNDHAGGVNDILQHYPNVEFIQSSHKNYQKNDRTFCQRGRNWSWQGLFFAVLSPEYIVQRAKNPHSCVILLTDGNYKVLLTGDADVATEQQILPYLSKIDVLQVGHHGSNTSTGSALLTMTRPEISVISSGRWNAWKFPHHKVIARLAEAKSAVYNNAELGQIRLIFTDKGIEIKTARTEFSPWYRRLIGSKAK